MSNNPAPDSRNPDSPGPKNPIPETADPKSPTFRKAAVGAADDAGASAKGTVPVDSQRHGRIRPFLSEEEWRARRRPESVQDIVDRVMTGVSGGRAAPAASLGARWEDVVGAEFVARTAPGSCESGKLVVLVRDGATASKMRFNTNQILQNAAKILGKGAVSAISFRVSPSVGQDPTT